MNLGSILLILLIFAFMCIFFLFTGNYLTKQASQEGVTLRFTNRIMLEMEAILSTVLILIMLIVFALIAYYGISYILHF